MGSFFIGFVGGKGLSLSTQKIVMIGFLGGFTTFSALTWESFLLIKQGNVVMGIVYPMISIVFGVVGTALGYYAIAFF